MLKIIQIVLIWLIFAFRSANSFTVCCRCCQQSLLVCQIPSLSFYFSFESSVYFAKAHWNVSAQRVAELMKTKFVDEHFQWKLHFTGQTNSLDSLRRSFRPTIELDSPNLFHGNVIFVECIQPENCVEFCGTIASNETETERSALSI